jgi:hypothetical protein
MAERCTSSAGMEGKASLFAGLPKDVLASTRQSGVPLELPARMGALHWARRATKRNR